MGDPVSQLKYSQPVGSLLDVSNRTKSDIVYAISRLSRHTTNRNREYRTALDRVFKYLRDIIDYYLTCTGYPDAIKG